MDRKSNDELWKYALKIYSEGIAETNPRGSFVETVIVVEKGSLFGSLKVTI